jgi:hypothetical protein
MREQLALLAAIALIRARADHEKAGQMPPHLQREGVAVGSQRAGPVQKIHFELPGAECDDSRVIRVKTG